ncbi:MAG: eukaryotic-like serine/threonine-protein kinase [Actinomycetota bacterium]|nr:eukaryotic-like serine/threonine-protein kinase [Actinomycetota bacterium]
MPAPAGRTLATLAGMSVNTRSLHAEAALDLVCGPDGPLPEAVQRYRLVQHLGSGGQADVYRGVRLCGGVASAPLTVKVFRPDPSRPLVDQLRSWDKGDAVLMDLGSRGVEGLCRRVDGFHGAPPHTPGVPGTGEPIPYQVLDYLSGWTLRDHLGAPGGPRLDAAAVLRGLAGTLLALHRPDRPTDCPVLHMDVKPSNLIVLPDGRVRLIDFTSARYDRRDHITSVAFTAEASAPEAFTGQVGPAYDVHGFGAVAYFLVTGQHPRAEADIPDPVSPDAPVAPWAVLRRDPELDRHPALRDHLFAPLADRPADRPRTEELAAWTVRLAELAAAVPSANRLAGWGRPAVGGTVRARATVPVTVPGAAPDRLARLEQEVVELRALVRPDATRVQPTVPPPPVPATRVAPAPVRGSAPVAPPHRPAPAQPAVPADPAPARQGARRGRRLTQAAVIVLAACWAVWSAFTLLSGGSPLDSVIGLVLAATATVAVFWGSRLIGKLVLGRRQRAGALPSHVATATFAVLCGLAFVSLTPFSWGPIESSLRSLLSI